MEIAYSIDFQIIKASDALVGKVYYCPRCHGKLNFYPGKARISHFRHAKGVPDEQKNQCELYSSNVNNSIFNSELIARQRTRLVIEKVKEKFNIMLKFPLIQEDLVNIQINNRYFTYDCKELKNFEFNSIDLIPSRLNNDKEVPLIGKYTLTSSDEKYEKLLGLKVSGVYEPFKEGPLIFKEIKGQYVSVPYRKLTLSGRFFIVSPRAVFFDEAIEILYNQNVNNFYIYELLMPIEFTEQLQSWFTKELRYTLLPATCHIDLISPDLFKKKGNTFEVSSSMTKWQVTNVGERPFNQRVIIENRKLERKFIVLNHLNQFTLDLKESDEYIIYMDQEVTDFITLKFISKINHSIFFNSQLLLNDENILFNQYSFIGNEKKTIQSSIPYVVTTIEEVDYKVNTEEKIPWNNLIRLDIPTIWSLKLESKTVKSSMDFSFIYSIYIRRGLYRKEICSLSMLQFLLENVKKSNFESKEKLIYFIRSLGNKMPQPVKLYIKEMESFK